MIFKSLVLLLMIVRESVPPPSVPATSEHLQRSLQRAEQDWKRCHGLWLLLLKLTAPDTILKSQFAINREFAMIEQPEGSSTTRVAIHPQQITGHEESTTELSIDSKTKRIVISFNEHVGANEIRQRALVFLMSEGALRVVPRLIATTDLERSVPDDSIALHTQRLRVVLPNRLQFLIDSRAESVIVTNSYARFKIEGGKGSPVIAEPLTREAIVALKETPLLVASHAGLLLELPGLSRFWVGARTQSKPTIEPWCLSLWSATGWEERAFQHLSHLEYLENQINDGSATGIGGGDSQAQATDNAELDEKAKRLQTQTLKATGILVELTGPIMSAAMNELQANRKQVARITQELRTQSIARSAAAQWEYLKNSGELHRLTIEQTPSTQESSHVSKR